jgi:hypothetical protein
MWQVQAILTFSLVGVSGEFLSNTAVSLVPFTIESEIVDEIAVSSRISCVICCAQIKECSLVEIAANDFHFWCTLKKPTDIEGTRVDISQDEDGPALYSLGGCPGWVTHELLLLKVSALFSGRWEYKEHSGACLYGLNNAEYRGVALEECKAMCESSYFCRTAEWRP